jgi:hypothetical protein
VQKFVRINIIFLLLVLGVIRNTYVCIKNNLFKYVDIRCLVLIQDFLSLGIDGAVKI